MSRYLPNHAIQTIGIPTYRFVVHRHHNGYLAMYALGRIGWNGEHWTTTKYIVKSCHRETLDKEATRLNTYLADANRLLAR